MGRLMRVAAVALAAAVGILDVPAPAEADDTGVSGLSATVYSGLAARLALSWSNPFPTGTRTGVTILDTSGTTAPKGERDPTATFLFSTKDTTVSSFVTNVGFLGVQTFTVFADYGDGRSVPASVTVDSAKFVLATTSQTLTYGKPVLIASVVDDAEKPGPVSGGTVVLYHSPYGGAGMAVQVGQATLGSDGRFSFSFTPEALCNYRIYYYGDSAHIGQESALVPVHLLPTLRLSAPGGKPKHNKKFTLALAVTPTNPGQTVRLQKLSHGKWQTVASTTTRSNGTAAFTVQETRKGTYKYRAFAPANTLHDAASGGTRTVKVG